ncbi:DNA-directed RNA polymerase subunit beta, partial [bacterium]|nr:DNA-directed RNA polymerase subunit beta [bacterium]
GYNFEDSILISERVVKEDVFTSIHIEEFEWIARDTKLGREEITRDIPNVGEEALANLDESGIIRIGAEVRPGDILVGKVTPKGETQLSPEEKLLRAIFGEKAGEVRDTSLKVPPGVEGTIIEARVFARKGVTKDERSQQIEADEVVRLQKNEEDQVRIVRETTERKVQSMLVGKTSTVKVTDDQRRQLLGKGVEITAEELSKIPWTYWADVRVGDEKLEGELERICRAMRDQIDGLKRTTQDKIARLQGGDELPPGVIKMVKIFVAIKRKLQVGDKMAGRHGNKGVLSRILPEEDLPYLADGTPVDIVLNPLGVPSRMNIGQILETHLGWAARELGRGLAQDLEAGDAPDRIRKRLVELYGSEWADKLRALPDEDVIKVARKAHRGIHTASPVFDGATEQEIFDLLSQAGLPETGQTTLYDGRTGEAFTQPVTVGVIYMMKLHHLVDDKIHARSTGPYSLVTQQPLGGKAQFGGQRFGEMEVWGLEAYGAAYTLQEMLTIKSDDTIGRVKAYEAIVKGENIAEPSIPESFKVLLKEMQSLALSVDVVSEAGERAEMGEEDDDLLKAAEELGIDLSGVRVTPVPTEEVDIEDLEAADSAGSGDEGGGE